MDSQALLMADPKPEKDDLAIPSFLDRRKPRPKPKPDRKAAMRKLVELGQATRVGRPLHVEPH